MTVVFVLALPIFPGRRQPSIVGRDELNYRVRNGNGWTLALISTNLLVAKSATLTPAAGLRPLARVRFAPLLLAFLGKRFAGLPRKEYEFYVIRQTRRTNWIIHFFLRLVKSSSGLRRTLSAHRSPDGAPSRTRTGDPLIKSQLLYQLS